jgi:hypothetical protein
MLTATSANKYLEHLVGKTAFSLPTLFLGLGTDRSTEVTYTGYARVASTGGNWAAAASRSIASSAGFTWGQRTDGGATQRARFALLYDASTAGNLNGFLPLVGTNVPKACSVARSGSVATISCPSHGYVVGDEVLVLGAVAPEYEGVFTVATVPDANTITVAVTGTPATPATFELATVRIVKLSPIDIGINSVPNVASGALTLTFPE